MAGFDYEVVIIGSGFGGSVAELRAVEKRYRVGVMEAPMPARQSNLPEG
jgi:cholesterol oxidase